MKIDFDCINSINDMKKIISKYNDNLDKIIELEKKLAISEAKIYTYEKIIASSNFKGILEKTKTNKKKVGEE